MTHPIAEKIRCAGGNLYLVGGAVRDQLMGREPKDKDYCVTGLTAEQFSRLFPVGGVEDIRRGIIRATSEAFGEDPLRVYRAARFAARFGFSVEPGTLEMMRGMKEELIHLTPERVGLEVIKALETENPSIFFRVLAEADVLDVHFPELDALIGVPQPPEHHPEGDAFEH